jgi:hypothetical protein
MMSRHYNRALRVHKTVLEGLERMLMEKFMNTQAAKDQMEEVAEMVKDPSRLDLEAIIQHDSVIQLHDSYRKYRQSILNGEMGKTSQFWLMYAERIWLVLRLLRATKQNDFDLHLSCVQDMAPLLLATDHQNYARYVTIYFLQMLNLKHSHPSATQLLKAGGFSVSRSRVPACRNPVDQTIEQTINRHAKSKGGIIGFSRNASAYRRWCMTRHVRAAFVTAALDMAGMAADEDLNQHKELSACEKRNSEQRVQNVVSSFNDFVNSFDVEEDTLFSL